MAFRIPPQTSTGMYNYPPVRIPGLPKPPPQPKGKGA